MEPDDVAAQADQLALPGSLLLRELPSRELPDRELPKLNPNCLS